MHRAVFILLASLASTSLRSQPVAVTFSVDMSHEVVSSHGVHIAGSFQSAAGLGNDWDPGSTPLSDLDGNKVYEITISMPPGYYEYKFVNDNAWGNNENPPSGCTVGSYYNRYITIGDANQIVPVVTYNSCNALLTLSVDMSGQTISPQGVHVMGDFQQAAGFSTNWDPAVCLMQDQNKDGIYTMSVWLTQGSYHYLVVNGNTAIESETPPDACTVDDNGKRVRTVTALVGGAIPTTYLFSSCATNIGDIPSPYSTYWWNDAVFYELFVRSFYDSNNDGIGDFQGIIQKLDYLNDGDPATHTDLGVTGIWLMPMMSSPSYHGYDVTDYYAAEPDYGTLADFQELLTAAHDRGIKIIIDMVMNHSSDQNQWFVQAAADQNNYRDWYVWSDTNPGYLGPWGQTVWYQDGSAFYYGLFWSGMPDLNYRHQPLKDEMFNVINFWLDQGVDGFRLDAIGALVENGAEQSYTPETLAVLHELNSVYKSTNPDAVTVGEVWATTPVVVPFVNEDRLDLCFEFDLASVLVNGINSGSAGTVRNQLQVVQDSYPLLQYGVFLTNHDMNRVFTQLGSDLTKMKQAAAIYLTLPGVPFIYYGEEVGMTGSGQDENKRRPMQWSTMANGGFTLATPWENVGDNYMANNVATMNGNPSSLLNHYRKLIGLRNDYVALRQGYYAPMQSPNANVLAFGRVHSDQAVLVLSNFSSSPAISTVSLGGSALNPGTYYLTEMMHGLTLGTVTIDAGGEISGLSIPEFINGRDTWVLLLSTEAPDVVTSIADKHVSVNIYPNPASNQVTVSVGSSDPGKRNVEIYNLLGYSVYHGSFSGEEMTIPTSNLPPGIFVVRIVVGSSITTRRLAIR